MKSTRYLGLAVLCCAVVPFASAAKPVADIPVPEVRRAAVDMAQRLARPPVQPKAQTDLPSPFSPPGFGKSANAPAAKGAEKPGAGPAAAAPVVETDRDILATLASKIPTTGTIILGDTPLLISGTNRIEVGSHFTVVYNGQEYELELVAIDRTTFTVRYKGEEFTRPIKQGRTP